MTYTPRNDWVLIRVNVREQSDGGVSLPQTSVEGKDFIVEGIGPDVESLSPGDRVFICGPTDLKYYDVPREQGLILIKQEHVALTMEEEPS